MAPPPTLTCRAPNAPQTTSNHSKSLFHNMARPPNNSHILWHPDIAGAIRIHKGCVVWVSGSYHIYHSYVANMSHSIQPETGVAVRVLGHFRIGVLLVFWCSVSWSALAGLTFLVSRARVSVPRGCRGVVFASVSGQSAEREKGCDLNVCTRVRARP